MRIQTEDGFFTGEFNERAEQTVPDAEHVAGPPAAKTKCSVNHIEMMMRAKSTSCVEDGGLIKKARTAAISISDFRFITVAG